MFIGTQTRLFVYVLSMLLSSSKGTTEYLQQRSYDHKAKILTIWPSWIKKKNLIGRKLLYSVLLVSAVQQLESVIHIYTHTYVYMNMNIYPFPLEPSFCPLLSDLYRKFANP